MWGTLRMMGCRIFSHFQLQSIDKHPSFSNVWNGGSLVNFFRFPDRLELVQQRLRCPGHCPAIALKRVESHVISVVKNFSSACFFLLRKSIECP